MLDEGSTTAGTITQGFLSEVKHQQMRRSPTIADWGSFIVDPQMLTPSMQFSRSIDAMLSYLSNPTLIGAAFHEVLRKP